MPYLNHDFPTLSIRPHRLQYVVNEFFAILLTFALATAHAFFFRGSGTFLGLVWHYSSMYGSLILAAYLVYQYLAMARMCYYVTAEQLIYKHGLVNHATEYMELYRVIDYEQGRTLLQQIFSLKTVTIYSGDRNSPVMRISGVLKDTDVVGEIRRRVEYNKKINHIYEVTNRP